MITFREWSLCDTRTWDLAVGYDFKNWTLPASINFNTRVSYAVLHVGPLWISIQWGWR